MGGTKFRNGSFPKLTSFSETENDEKEIQL